MQELEELVGRSTYFERIYLRDPTVAGDCEIRYSSITEPPILHIFIRGKSVSIYDCGTRGKMAEIAGSFGLGFDDMFMELMVNGRRVASIGHNYITIDTDYERIGELSEAIAGQIFGATY